MLHGSDPPGAGTGRTATAISGMIGTGGGESTERVSIKPSRLSQADLDVISYDLKAMENEFRRYNLFDLVTMIKEIEEDIKQRGRVSSDDLRLLIEGLAKAGRVDLIA